MSATTEKFDVCIVGAGCAGGVLAAYLGKHGKRVAVIEKNLAEQDRIVGELLQPGGVEQLKKMGLEELLEGFDAQPVHGYALFFNDSNFKLAYPPEASGEKAGRGFRNGKFIQRIRTYIQQQPNITVIEGTVTRFDEVLEEHAVKGVWYTNAQGEEQAIHASLTVVCDGAFSGFREKLSDNKAKISGYFLGIVLKNADMPYPLHGHVVVADPSPFLCYPISSTETRVLIDFPGEQPPRKSPELIQFLTETIGSQLPEQLKPSYFEAVAEGKFKMMPNYRMAAEPFFKMGAVLLGDSLNMRHPLTGGGMTVAFTDVYHLGESLLKIKDFNDEIAVAASVHEFYTKRHEHNATINILADALYGVFKNKDLREACYTYLQRGGKYSEEPVKILSAVSRDVTLLMKHFFAVAAYGAGNTIKPFPTPRRLRKSWKMIGSAVHIVEPLIMSERPSRITRGALRISKRIFS